MPFERYELVVPKLSEKALMQHRQKFPQASMSGLRKNYLPISQTPRTSPSLTSAIVRSRDDPSLIPDDQFVRAKSRPPLPRLHERSVGFKKASQSKRTSQKMMSMKPTLLDQESETWDDEESGNTRSTKNSEDDIEQESEETSGEIESSSASGSSWETQGESVTESVSSSPPESNDVDDDSGFSDSPPYKKGDNKTSDFAKQRKKAMGRFTRFKNKLGQHLERTFQQKGKEKSDERRRKSDSKGLTTHKQQGGHFHGLVEAMMRHRRHSKKQKHKKLQSHGRKTHWWQTLKRQGGVKFPNRGRVKLGKRQYLCKKDQELDENNKTT
ncbi:unnamed protein product [Arabis nemorensis]|uniref:Uncharacterized protein n=1 Tax=Arabis nemorensis TaxID=586526 RepID=A0A565CW41_9BRAS|nr:unnamed protein product [Arabis nemorensis]